MAHNAGSVGMTEPVPIPHGTGSWIASSAIPVLRRALGVVWFLSLAAIVLLAVLTNLGPRFGLEVYAVRGGSMTPTIPIGAAVVAARTAPDDIRVGDIVTIRADNGVVFTHRVVEIDASEADHWLRTKGDANATADAAPVPPTAVVGVVGPVIPLAGYLLAMMSTPAGLVCFLAFAGGLLLAIWELEEAERAATPRRRLAGSPDVTET